MPVLTMNYGGLKKVISGGQDGVDRGALEAAKSLNVETGGTAPRGFRTAHGDDLSLSTQFGLVEHTSRDYPPRTELNVVNSDGTLIIASVVSSPGTKLTIKYIKKHKRPSCIIQIPANEKNLSTWDFHKAVQHISDFIVYDTIEILNVAGNHKRPEYHHSVTVQLVRGVIENLGRHDIVVYDGGQKV